MENENIRFKLIFIPFLKVSVGFIISYTFLNWGLLIQFHVFELSDEVVNLFGPMILALPTTIIWLWPGTKYFYFKRLRNGPPDNSRARTVIIMFPWVAISLSTIFAQSYLQAATGKMTKLDNIAQIKDHKLTKYYTLDNYYIDKSHLAFYKITRIKGQNVTSYTLYIVCPMLRDSSEIQSPPPHPWLGIKYRKEINRPLSKIEKESLWTDFTTNSMDVFAEKNFENTVYFKEVGMNTDHNRFNKAIARILNTPTGKEIILLPEDAPFEDRNRGALAWIFAPFMIGSGVLSLLLLVIPFDEDKWKQMNNVAC